MRGWVADVSQLADALEVDRVAVVGWSGGATYALACAAVVPDRLTGAGEIGGAGWPVDEQPGAFDALDDNDKRVHDLARSDRRAAVRLAEELATKWIPQLQERPEAVMDGTEPTQDLRHFEDPAWAANFCQAVREAVRQGPRCYAWDSVAGLAPWGFALEDVTIDFHLWHGVHDPYEGGPSVGYWASRIPGARVTTWEDSGHFAVVDHWQEIVTTVTGG